MKGVLLIAMMVFASLSYAQFSLYNLSEYQLGNLPEVDPSNRSGWYNQLNLNYRLNNWRASVRVENYDASDAISNSYVALSQYNISYKDKGLKVEGGHFYETLGKGMLLRSYEIRGGLYEDAFLRKRHGFYRDIRGGKINYRYKALSVKAFGGEMLNNLLAPDNVNRYEDRIMGSQINYSMYNQDLGLMYLNNLNSVDSVNWVSSSLGGAVLNDFQYYLELSQKMDEENALFSPQSYGLYANFNYSTLGFGVSAELKRYVNMKVGNGVNEPPTLVKEHVYRLLNRKTHAVELSNESGTQVEMYYQPSFNHLFTFNYTYGENNIYNIFRFSEVFIEWVYTNDLSNELKLFVDNSYDELAAARNRFTAGVYYTHMLSEKYSLGFESEWQDELPTWTSKRHQNVYAALSFANSTHFSVALQLEYTNDPFYTDLGSTANVELERYFPGLMMQYKPHRKHNLILFAGERRGGPACTSGICYEVLDFKGLELRYTYRLN